MKYYMLLLGLCLFGCKDNTPLQTSVTVNVSKAGTLDSLLSKYKKEVIDTLVVTGKINEIDLITIKYMSNLSYIDLEETELSTSISKNHILVNGNQNQIIKLPNNQSLFYSLNPLEIHSKDNEPLDIDGVLLKSKGELFLYSRDHRDSMYIVSKSSKDRKFTYKDLSIHRESFKGVDLPRIFISYNQKVNGYKVNVMWFPSDSYYFDQSPAILHFQNDTSEFYIYNPSYHEGGVYEKYGEKTPPKDGDTIYVNYTPKESSEYAKAYGYLADHNVPFFFQDVDFDGEDELLITNWQCGSKGSSTYDVYKVNQYYEYRLDMIKLTDAPFCKMENGQTEFDPKEETIKLHLNFSAFEYAIHTYKKVKQDKIEWTEPEDSYKFELVRVDHFKEHSGGYIEYKQYEKDGYKYKLVKDEKTPVNQKDK